MAFQSYCWSLGTTSFRVQNLNYKIERQLQLLNELWSDSKNQVWDNFTQEKYYEIMHKSGFVVGKATRRDKDARQKTSGLVEIGIVDKNRKITEVGNLIIDSIDKEDFEDDNIFNIHKDSFIYLKQFLKLQKEINGKKVKPFVVLIYLLSNLEYITREEFTYILPLCLDNKEAAETVELIKKFRKNEITIDNIIKEKMSKMTNYSQALEYLNNNKVDSLDEFANNVDMNRKSKEYSKSLYEFYVDLSKIIKNELNENELDIIMDFIKKQSDKNSKVAKYWKEYFKYDSRKILTDEWKNHIRETKIFNVKNKSEYNFEFFRIMQTAKWKANLEDYADLNRRYFSLADILIFKDGKVELDVLPKYYFLDIAEKLLNTKFLNVKEYKRFIENDIKFEDIYDCLDLNIDEAIRKIRENYPESKISKDNVKEFIKDERLKRFKMLIESKFRKENLIYLFKNIEKDNRKDVEEYLDCEANIPTILEYVLGIAWYRISSERGNILDFMKLSLDANLLPKNHAGGGTADIVYNYKKNEIYNDHDLLLEATLTDSTSQRKAEMEPVSRHLIRKIQEDNNENSYAIFVANILNQEVLSDFRSRKNYWYNGKNGEDKQGLKIIPLSIGDIITILNKDLKYNELFKVFDIAYKDQKINDLKWYDLLVKEQLENI